MSERTSCAAALAALGVLLPTAAVLEIGPRGDTDADDAAASVRFLAEHGDAYVFSGACFVAAAVVLLLAASRLPWRSTFTTALATTSATLLVLVGALRMSAPGPIDYISGLDKDWGESAYLVVHMVGTQSALLGGLVLLGLWAATVSRAAWPERLLPRPVVVLGFVPLAYPVAALLGRFAADDLGLLWVVSLLSLFLGLPVWCLAAGVSLAVRGRDSAPEAPARVRPL